MHPRDQFERLRDALPEDLRDPVSFLYFSGWHVSEMRALEWRDVDLEGGGIIRLRPDLSKTKDGRPLPLRRELAEIIDRARERRIPECTTVFHRDGRPIALFRRSWATACKKAGLGNILVHDLPRTAVRNLVRAGVPDKIAMALSGHKTRSGFDRDNIVAEDGLARAIENVSDHLAAQPQTPAIVLSLKKRSA